MALTQWCVGLLVLLTCRLSGCALLGAVSALAVVPSCAGGFLDGFVDLHGRLAAVEALTAVECIQLILLDDVDEFVGVVLVLGISAVSQPLCPTAVVLDVELIEDAVSRSREELGVVEE